MSSATTGGQNAIPKKALMSERIKVVGLGGSLAPASKSLAALKIVLDGAAEAEAEIELFDIRTLDLPLFRPGMGEAPAVARRWAEAACEASGLLWSSPLYHGTISGSFKNALDWLLSTSCGWAVSMVQRVSCAWEIFDAAGRSGSRGHAGGAAAGHERRV
jgi:NAD(P)H-dependent FMN reductase